MFGRIKQILLAFVLVVGFSSCSSDDGKTEIVPEGKEYLVSVTVTENAAINKIMGVVYEGKKVKNDVVTDVNTTEWSKVYNKTDAQKISFTAQGFGDSEDSKMEIKITLEGEVVGQAFAHGKTLMSTVVIQADKRKNEKI